MSIFIFFDKVIGTHSNLGGIAKLKNLSLIASMTNDADWQHELYSRIEKIEG
ncbi:DUF7667 family protein [Brevibacillus laterosporus]|uniref:DUF7667 family protein n=1 Tax=Brevibacillus laterosporus TaxID=1465 RepID=UPI003CC7E9A9